LGRPGLSFLSTLLVFKLNHRQTFGTAFQSDGRITGTEQIQTVTCNTDNTCNISVPAPGFALVFLVDVAADPESFPAVKTFATTALTKTQNTVTINPTLLATSNGQAGANFMEGSTSQGKRPSGAARLMPPLAVVVSAALGVASVIWA
jgi:hypothetical protein